MARARKKTVETTPEPVEESRHDRFKRIGKARMNRALTTIRLIGNLAGANYEYDEHEVKVLSDALLYAVTETIAKFEQKMHKSPPLQFDFPEAEVQQQRQKQNA